MCFSSSIRKRQIVYTYRICLGFLLEIFLHIRLTCCLTARSITPIFLREQQLSLDVLYIFLCLTVTALPFYIYRSMEVLFESIIVFNQSDIINSRMLAQLILLGICFKPFLYILLLCPSNILFKFKCYTSIHIDRSTLLLSNEQQKSLIETTTFQIPIFYPKIHRKFRTQASRNSVGNNESSLIVDGNSAIANNNVLL